MAIPSASSVAASIVADLGDHDARSLAAWTKVCERIFAAVKLATVTPDSPPPGGTGMTVVVMGAPVPVLGTANIT